MSAASDPRNEALAAEHAAVWTYGVLAARAGASDPALATRLTRGYRLHATARDTLLTALAAEKVAPAVALPAYPLPARLDSPAALTAAAAAVEAHGCEVYAWLVSQSTGATRVAAITALEMRAVRELGLRGTPETFPGAAELADHTAGLDTGP